MLGDIDIGRPLDSIFLRLAAESSAAVVPIFREKSKSPTKKVFVRSLPGQYCSVEILRK